MDTALVKYITGKDTRSVRKLYSEPVNYRPSDMIMLLTNNKPHLSADDQAFWDRCLLIPFTERFRPNPIPGERQEDPELPGRLMAEASGILAWLVRGTLAYQREGLNPPESVTQATKEYREEENIINRFIEDNFEEDSEAKVRQTTVWEIWNRWSRFKPGCKEITRKKLMEKLSEQGHASHKGTGGYYVVSGLRPLDLPDTEGAQSDAGAFSQNSWFNEMIIP